MNERLKHKLEILPQKSGVYVMRNSAGQIIYVGKAKVLKNRVSQYFHKSKKPDKVELMVSEVADVDFFVVPTEKDAFALERNLIRENQPFFNILLKDGKSYSYIGVDMKETFPRFVLTRKTGKKGWKYFGPYFQGVKCSEVLEILKHSFPLRTCKDKIDGVKTKRRECLNFSLGLCSAPCTRKIGESDYRKIVDKAIRFLSGEDDIVEKILQQKMKDLAEKENFERALEVRENLKTVEKLKGKIITEFPKDAKIDVFGFATDNSESAVTVLTVRSGKILGLENFNVIDASLGKGEVVKNFISSYFEQNVDLPDEIIVGFEIENSEELEDYLYLLKGKKAKIVFSQKGEKKKLLEMANENSSLALSKGVEKSKKKIDETLGALKNLQKKLSLPSFPKRIECYDISHISGTDKVGSMVVFIDGEKVRSHYRKFKIRTVEGNDDFSSLKEIISRRLEDLRTSKDVSFSQKPDLVVIDGGKGQLSSVREIFDEKHIKDISLISLAKQFEEVFTVQSNRAIVFEKASVELRLLEALRDEAHRFAITFHRSLRSKRMIRSSSNTKK